MDIQITNAELVEDRWIHIERLHREGDKEWTSLHRMPKEILAIRAAEYNLEVDDPRVMDIVLMEPFFPETTDEVHPLYSRGTVAEALTVQESHLQAAKKKHGTPNKKAHELLRKHAPDDIAWAVKHHRDVERAKFTHLQKAKPMGDQIKTQALTMLHSEALEVEREMETRRG